MEFTPEQRLALANNLPREIGSLRESVQIKRIRDKVQLTEEERDTLDIDRETGSFDPTALDELDNVEMDLDSDERETIALSLVKKEQDGSVPTTDAFVEIIQKFSDEIDAVKEDLNEDD